MNKNEKSSPSTTQLKLVEQSSGRAVAVDYKAYESLAKKSKNSQVPISMLEQVYARGYLTAEPDTKNTPEQQAFARVNSFLNDGKALELDHDLIEAIKVPDGKKHMHIIKQAIKSHQERMQSLDQQSDKGQNVQEDLASIIGNKIRRSVVKSVFGGKKSKNTPPSFLSRWKSSLNPGSSVWKGQGQSGNSGQKTSSAPKSPDDPIEKKLQAKEVTHQVKQEWEKRHPELSKVSQNVRRKKDLVRKSIQTGSNVSGAAANLKASYLARRAAHDTRERGAEQEYVTKKTGFTSGQQTGRDAVNPLNRSDIEKRTQAQQEYKSTTRKGPGIRGVTKLREETSSAAKIVTRYALTQYNEHINIEKKKLGEAYPEFGPPTTMPYGTKQPERRKPTKTEMDAYKNKKPRSGTMDVTTKP